ncbi:hypothetical protein F7D08_0024 [Bifidobacterium cebidarum]|uniref:DUF3027 domain-containing protein n=1 Tax=Bifidobacterium cebidarum TaxID=2650773 RepID=A0A6I1GBS1_9BIFI|nr:DUF3027 domain-containing protein [Bifidobacterium cebidarum]KAB7789074.1 hypothetical protein F7D08_0024 [Bifidobacterium cebidarum]
MTDSTETTVTPDPRAIAHAVLLEVADEPEQVGQFVVANELEDHVTDFRFAANIRGYEGWQWSVTLYHDQELDSWTVNESSLIPTEEALLPPKWIPWKDRLEPTDLSPTDSIGTDPDDERLETGEVEESSVPDVNDAAETFRLTRRHVLSPLGRAQAAKRWYEGPRGPKALSTKTAAGNLCSDCGFFVPLTGELDRMFGVCANKWSPDDGRVVSLDHGCGEHSEIEPPEPSHLWVQSKPALDDLHIDIVARPKTRKAEESEPKDEPADVEVSAEPAKDAGAVDGVDVIVDADNAVVNNAADDTGAKSDDGVAATDTAVDESSATAVDPADMDGDTDDQSGTQSIEQPIDDSSASEDALDDVDAGETDADYDDDEATEEDIINNTSVDDGDDDIDIDDEFSDTTDDVAPELETVIDLIEQLRQSKAEEESDADDDNSTDLDAADDSVDSQAGVLDDSDESGNDADNEQ